MKLTVKAIALVSALTFSQLSTAEVAKAGSYKIDPGHTFVTFTISHLGFSDMQGRFNTVEGNLSLAPKGESSVQVSIETASVDTNHKKRDDHLRGPDFFNARQYPEIKFTSTKVSYGSTGEPSKIEGNFSLHGVTKPIVLDVKPVGAGKDPWGGYRAGYNASVTINRSDYGMEFMLGGIPDQVTINLSIEAIKQ